jgi:hypothetical protein
MHSTQVVANAHDVVKQTKRPIALTSEKGQDEERYAGVQPFEKKPIP